MVDKCRVSVAVVNWAVATPQGLDVQSEQVVPALEFDQYNNNNNKVIHNEDACSNQDKITTYVTLNVKRGLKDFTENREIFSRSWCVNFNFHGVKRRNHSKTKNFLSWRETNHAVNGQ